MATILEGKIAELLLELGDGDEFRREQVIESFAENATNEFLESIGLETDEAFAIMYPSVLVVINKYIDWGLVDKYMTESQEDALEWFNAYEEAVDE